MGPTEVAGFGLSSLHNPLYLEEIVLIRQWATRAGVGFDDHAVADLFDVMTDRGIPPQHFARIWLHTHPGSSVTPSGIDEETFHRCFGACDWAVMAILGRTGQTSARLRFNVGPGCSIKIPTAVDWSGWPALAKDESLNEWIATWKQEYTSLVEVQDVYADEFRLERDAFLDWESFGPFSNPSNTSASTSPDSLTPVTGDQNQKPVQTPDSPSHPALDLGISGWGPFDLLNPANRGGLHVCE